ncbi:MAG TPA: response regulator, partial [Phototrophicaceae bacterium]|nr:response regulator [Phototrophicaceae bacterium]
MPHLHSPLILAVDDEPANLALLERALCPNYRVIGVSNGYRALELLALAPFDLVLLDIMMADMDGIQTLERIRSNPETADLPVIIISALVDTCSLTRALEKGANDYLTKPIDIEVTRARVQTQTRLKFLEDERKRAFQRLEETQQLKDSFLRIASHDLKGPIHNIRMVASLMQRSASKIPDGMVLLEALETSTSVMETMIEDFIDLAVLQTGELNLKLEQIVL